jgi:hypothetical protein
LPVGALVSFTATGTERWRVDFGASTSFINHVVREPGQDRFYFTGCSLSPPFNCDSALLGQVTSTGQILIDPFLKSFQVGTSFAVGQAIRIKDDQLYIGVNTGNGPWLVVADFAGNIKKTMQLAPSGSLSGLQIASDHFVFALQVADSSGVSNAASFICKADLEGNGVWGVTLDDVVGSSVVEDAQGFVYLAGTQLQPGTSWPYILVKFDQAGSEMWRIFWDGDNPNSQGNRAHDLILRPQDGVVVIGQLTEFQGAPGCFTFPNCWDFGAWAVDANGNTQWKLRRDFNQSPWDAPSSGIFDSAGKLILVGNTVPSPTGNDFTDNRDITVAKFTVP